MYTDSFTYFVSFLTFLPKSKICLNETTGDGTWKFLFDSPEGIPAPIKPKVNPHPAPSLSDTTQDFDFSAWDAKPWADVKVPGGLVMQGFDIKNNTEYYYKRDVDIPADYDGSRVVLRFDGAYSNVRVWVNDEYVRFHLGGFTTWDCAITDFVTPGKTAKLVVGIADLEDKGVGTWNPDGTKKLGDPSWGSVYAHHNMGGLNRDVSLLALPKDHIARTYIETELDDAFEDAELAVTAQLNMVSKAATLKIELLDGRFDAEAAKAATVLLSGEVEFQNPAVTELPPSSQRRTHC